jgi:hypothetical protein
LDSPFYQNLNLNSCTLAERTQITRNGKTARYNELKVSDSIQVKYLERRDLDSGLGGHFNGLDFFPIF